MKADVEKNNDTVAPAQAPIVEEPEAEAAAAVGAEVTTNICADIAFVIDILFTGNLILFHLEYHLFLTLLFPSVGLRYLSHCRTPCPVVVWNVCLSH